MRTLLVMTACLSTIAVATMPSQSGAVEVPSVELDASIDPASADWVDQALDDAARQGAPLVIIALDTPGGLDTSMRRIVKKIIAAPMPVVVYVSPDGARAASAGLYITQSADVAAMAPQTNIGSATPISIGPGEQDRVLGRKVRNDAAAYVRALASGHGRNPDLAEQMVRRAINVTAGEAKSKGLIDIVAANESELLRDLNGYKVKGPKGQVLKTAGYATELKAMPLKFQLIGFLVDPNIAFILLLIGIAGLAFELLNPGGIFPGIIGGLSFILSLYGLAQLPVTVAGIMLVLLAMALFVAETQITSHGVLGLAGAVALGAGGLLLFSDGSGVGVSWPVVIATTLLFSAFIVFVAGKAIAARKEKVHTGWEELVGMEGVVRVPLDPVGQIFIQGALWRAHSSSGRKLGKDDRVVVERVDGLTLVVRRQGSGQAQTGIKQE